MKRSHRLCLHSATSRSSDTYLSCAMTGFFGAFRTEGFPTQFPEHKTAAGVDVLEAGFILAFVILACCFYLVLAGYGRYHSGRIFIRVTASLFIGAVLMTSNFGQEWEVGHVTSKTAYKAGQAEEIKARVGLTLGLRSLNVTLRRVDEEEHKGNNALSSEIVNYNERFWWTWDQGRFGFGPYAGELQKEFRRAQLQGLPLPILWVVDYFTVDGEGLRFGRYYRTAGWYAHIAMWSAFPCWLLANIFFMSVIRYGAFFITVTGLLQVLACILWASIRNPLPLVIPFEDAELRTNFGVNFWLTLCTGIFCILVGILVVIFDLRFPEKIASFFGMDPLASYEECVLTKSELELVRKDKRNKFDNLPVMELNTVVISSDDTEDTNEPQYILRRRSVMYNAQKSLYRATTQAKSEDDDQPQYLNVPHLRIPAVVAE